MHQLANPRHWPLSNNKDANDDQKDQKSVHIPSFVWEASSEHLAKYNYTTGLAKNDRTTTQGVGAQKVNKWLTKAPRTKVAGLAVQHIAGHRG
jgi:hypothetical protein